MGEIITRESGDSDYKWRTRRYQPKSKHRRVEERTWSEARPVITFRGVDASQDLMLATPSEDEGYALVAPWVVSLVADNRVVGKSASCRSRPWNRILVWPTQRSVYQSDRIQPSRWMFMNPTSSPRHIPATRSGTKNTYTSTTGGQEGCSPYVPIPSLLWTGCNVIIIKEYPLSLRWFLPSHQRTRGMLCNRAGTDRSFCHFPCY